jgi:BNR repeat-like domain
MTHKNKSLSYAEALGQALIPAVPNLAPGSEYSDESRLFQGIPSIEWTPGGRLWATWYGGGQGESPLNYVMLASSADNGKNWTPPALVIDPPGHVRAVDPNVWLDPNGRLWLFWMQCHTLHDGRWGVWAMTTDDPGEERPAWSAPRRLADGIMLNKPAVRDNGEWLFPISYVSAKMLKNEKLMLPAFLRTYLLALMSPGEVQAVEEREGACVYVSADDGKTVVKRGCVRAPEECRTHNEHMIVERRDGSLWMLLRTSYGIGQSVSTDGGATWSPVVESGIPHASSRFHLRRLLSGRLLLVKNGPMALTDASGAANVFNRSHLTAYLSDDDGRNWSQGLLLEERGCTYPDAAQGTDGTIYVIYDHGRRKEKSILMTVFSEEDVLAGKFVSPRARQKVLVNQATGVIPDEENWSQFKGKDDPEEPLIFTGI